MTTSDLGGSDDHSPLTKTLRFMDSIWTNYMPTEASPMGGMLPNGKPCSLCVFPK